MKTPSYMLREQRSPSRRVCRPERRPLSGISPRNVDTASSHAFLRPDRGNVHLMSTGLRVSPLPLNFSVANSTGTEPCSESIPACVSSQSTPRGRELLVRQASISRLYRGFMKHTGFMSPPRRRRRRYNPKTSLISILSSASPHWADRDVSENSELLVAKVVVREGE